MTHTNLLRSCSLVAVAMLVNAGLNAQVRISPNAAAPTTNKAIFELNELTLLAAPSP